MEPGDTVLSGKRVLIVEGHPSVREMLSNIAGSWGMEVSALSAGREVEQMAADRSFDFAVLDTVLPDMDGFLLARQIRAQGISPHVVMISRIGERIQRDNSFSGWLTKPVKPRLLKSIFTDLISPATGLSENPPVQSPVQAERKKDLSILLAEDNAVNQKVALIMLKHLDYKADVAGSGPEVLVSLKKKHYDVILMDIQMPDMDGLEATRLIRKMSGSSFEPYIIAMTAYALDGDREEFLSTGMNDYLSKPIQIEELKSALKKYEEIRTR